MTVTFEQVSKVYSPHGSSVRTIALDNVSLTLEEGQLVVLLGPSGCGKTTLLKLLGGFERQTGPDRGTMFQAPTLFPWLSTLDNVLYGSRVRGMQDKATIERAQEVLRTVGLADFQNHLPHNLSGGMQQRVAIARVLINDPAIILADEPFAALDEYTRRAMQELFLHAVSDRSRTLLFVTHSIEEAVFLADRIVIMTPRPGKISRCIDVKISRPRARSHREFLYAMGEIFEIVSQHFSAAVAEAP